MEADVKKAVDSIPSFVDAADMFLVLCPPAEHVDTEVVCDQSTWARRGWCRVELAAAALSRKPRHLVMINSATTIFLMFPTDFIRGMPGSGDFTVDSDRVPLFPLVEQLVDSHLSLLWSQGESQFATHFERILKIPWIEMLASAVTGISEMLGCGLSPMECVRAVSSLHLHDRTQARARSLSHGHAHPDARRPWDRG